MIGAKYQGFEWKHVEKIIMTQCVKKAGTFQDEDKLHGQLYKQKNEEKIDCKILPPWQEKVFQAILDYSQDAERNTQKSKYHELGLEIYGESMLPDEYKSFCDKDLKRYFKTTHLSLKQEEFEKKYIPYFRTILSQYFSMLRHIVDAKNMTPLPGKKLTKSMVLKLSKIERLLRLVVREYDNWSENSASQSLLPQLLGKDKEELLEEGIDLPLPHEHIKLAKLIIHIDFLVAKDNKEKKRDHLKFNHEPLLPNEDVVDPVTMAKNHLPYLDRVSLVAFDRKTEEFLNEQDIDDFHQQIAKMEQLEKLAAHPTNIIQFPPKSPYTLVNNDTSNRDSIIASLLSEYEFIDARGLFKLMDLETGLPSWERLCKQADKDVPRDDGEKWSTHKYRKRLKGFQAEFARSLKEKITMNDHNNFELR